MEHNIQFLFYDISKYIYCKAAAAPRGNVKDDCLIHHIPPDAWILYQHQQATLASTLWQALVKEVKQRNHFHVQLQTYIQRQPGEIQIERDKQLQDELYSIKVSHQTDTSCYLAETNRVTLSCLSLKNQHQNQHAAHDLLQLENNKNKYLHEELGRIDDCDSNSGLSE